MWRCTFCGHTQEAEAGEDRPLCPLCLVELVEEGVRSTTRPPPSTPRLVT